MTGGSVKRLIDGYGRVHDDLRVSVTDRCNLRCSYCMPVEPHWFPRNEILAYEELARLVRVAAGIGVRKVRITGGEPLVRRDLPRFVERIASIEGIEDLSLTTNAVRLEEAARALRDTGIRRINVSLDTLDRGRFERLTRRDALGRVLAGLDAAAHAGLGPIKINVVLLRGVNDDEAERFVELGRDRGFEVRFIEFMPLENGGTWNLSRVVTGAELRERIASRWPIAPDRSGDRSAPATRFRFLDGRGAVGFIDSVTAPFCAVCARVRLSCDGRFRVCLYDDREADLKSLLRGGAGDARLAEEMIAAVSRKGRGGALEILESKRAIPLVRTMHQIGG